MTLKVRAAGISWYNPDDYGAIRRIMSDRHKLAATYNEWLRDAEAGEQKLRSEGYIVVRAFIDSKTFPDWCLARGLDINAEARMAFANGIAYNQVRGAH